jgi:hypothetical protein
MKSFISFIKNHEVTILLVGLLFGVISFVASLVALFFFSHTPEESNFIFSFGIVALVGGCFVPMLLLTIND